MLFYRIINKITRNKWEIDKIFFSGVDAQIFADKLNKQFKPEGCYIPDPFIYIMSEEEKEMYSGIAKKRKYQRIENNNIDDDF